MSALAPAIGTFDLETTGVDPATDRIVTAYVGVLDASGAVISGREWMIRPDGYVISEGATNVHGITTEHATQHGRPFTAVLPEIIDALASIPAAISGHNLSYDFTMLAHEMDRAGNTDPVAFINQLDIVDTFVLDKQIDMYRRGKRTLTAIAPLYGVELADEEAHGAAADAIAAGRIALKILTRPQLQSIEAGELLKLQRQWSREQRASLRDYKRRTGEPAFDIDLNWPLYESALALAAPAEVFTF